MIALHRLYTVSDIASGAQFKQLPAIFTHADALVIGISERQLYAIRDEGQIEQVGRGIYIRSDFKGDTNLLTIQF